MALLKSSRFAAPAPTTAQVTAILRQQVRSGGLSIGDALPPERTLAATIGVARGTVRAALQQLQSEGIIGQEGYRRRVRAVPRTPAPGGQTPGVFTQTIATLVYSSQVSGTHRAPGWETFVEVGILQQARDLGLHTMMFHLDSLTRSGGLVELLEHPPQGLAVCASIYRHPAAAEILQRLIAAGPRLVFEGQPPISQGHDRVNSDHAAGAELVARFLLEQGRRRIVTMLPTVATSQYWVRQRQVGYERALRAAGVAPLPPLLTGRLNDTDKSEQDFEVAVMQVLGYLVDYQRRHGGFDAVMSASDGNVPHVAAALRKLGLTPQQDVLITGYDNFYSENPLRQWEPTDPLVTVDKDNVAIGRRLVRLLVNPRDPATPPRTEMVPPTLVHVPDPSDRTSS